MSARQRSKVGIKYEDVPMNRQMIVNHANGDFISVADGITFGVLNEKAFHTGTPSWDKESIIKWARVNAAFFRRMSDNLNEFAQHVEDDKVVGKDN